MFITESPSNLTAVDATTGRPYWRYEHPLPDDLRICCGRNNRGVAILGDTLYMSTLDAHLVAIDARQRQPRLGRRGRRLPGRLQQDSGAPHRPGTGW